MSARIILDNGKQIFLSKFEIYDDKKTAKCCCILEKSADVSSDIFTARAHVRSINLIDNDENVYQVKKIYLADINAFSSYQQVNSILELY